MKRGRMYISALSSRYYDDAEAESELVDFSEYMKNIVNRRPNEMEFRFKSNKNTYFTLPNY